MPDPLVLPSERVNRLCADVCRNAALFLPKRRVRRELCLVRLNSGERKRGVLTVWKLTTLALDCWCNSATAHRQPVIVGRVVCQPRSSQPVVAQRHIVLCLLTCRCWIRHDAKRGPLLLVGARQLPAPLS